MAAVNPRVALDGINITQVADLIYDTSNTTIIRRRQPDIYRRALEDFFFVFFWASGVTVENRIWPTSNKTELFLKLVREESQGKGLNIISQASSDLENEPNDYYISAGVKEHLQALGDSVYNCKNTWEHMIENDFNRWGKNSKQLDKPPLDPEEMEYLRPYLKSRTMFELIPESAIQFGISAIRKADVDMQNYKYTNYLEEFVRRLLYTHVLIGWYYLKQCNENSASYLPYATRTSLLLHTPDPRKERVTQLRDLFLPFLFPHFLRTCRNEMNPEDFVRALVEFCLYPSDFINEARNKLSELLVLEKEKDFRKKYSSIKSELCKINPNAALTDQLTIGISHPLFPVTVQYNRALTWFEKLRPNWWIRPFRKYEDNSDEIITKRLAQMFPHTFRES